MATNLSSRTSSLRLTSLPIDVVLLHVVPYLCPSDIGSMSRVNRHFHDIFDNPHPWKKVRICFKRGVNFQKSPHLQETMKRRQIRDVKLVELDLYLLKTIIETLPSLETLCLPRTTAESVGVLVDCASMDKLRLKKLILGEVVLRTSKRACFKFYHNLAKLLSSLSLLENVEIGPLDFTYEEWMPHCLSKEIWSFGGRLTCFTLTNCCNVKVSFILRILLENQYLHTLGLLFVENLTWDCSPIQLEDQRKKGLNDLWAKICPKLQVLNLRGSLLPDSITFAQPGPITSLTSLDLSLCTITNTFTENFNFPNLRKLNLTNARVASKQFLSKLVDCKHLEWLELSGCKGVNRHLQCIATSLGNTLQYLAVGNLAAVTDTRLKDILTTCPALRSLDIHSCNQITDALLIELFFKSNQTQCPKLRKLCLVGCEQISGEMVDSVRLKTRNQLLIEI